MFFIFVREQKRQLNLANSNSTPGILLAPKKLDVANVGGWRSGGAACFWRSALRGRCAGCWRLALTVGGRHWRSGGYKILLVLTTQVLNVRAWLSVGYSESLQS